MGTLAPLYGDPAPGECLSFYLSPDFDKLLADDTAWARSVLNMDVRDVLAFERLTSQVSDLHLVADEAYRETHPDPERDRRIDEFITLADRCRKRADMLLTTPLDLSPAVAYWVQRFREETGRDFASATSTVALQTSRQSRVFGPMSLAALLGPAPLALTPMGCEVYLAPRWLAEVWVMNSLDTPARGVAAYFSLNRPLRQENIDLVMALCGQMELSDAIKAAGCLHPVAL